MGPLGDGEIPLRLPVVVGVVRGDLRRLLVKKYAYGRMGSMEEGV